MLNPIGKYQDYFEISNAKGTFMKFLFGFMLTLPHLITILIFIPLFPSQWLGIIIVGLLLPDFIYFFHMFIYPGEFKKTWFSLYIGKRKRKICHLLTFIVIIFLLLNKEYVLFSAGAIHLFLDMLGF